MKKCYRCFSVARKSIKSASLNAKSIDIVYNEVNIQMINRNIQKALFGRQIASYKQSKKYCDLLIRHGINAAEPRKSEPATTIDFSHILGQNVKQHFELIASKLTEPYTSLVDSLPINCLSLPKFWVFQSGWTRYIGNSTQKVAFPEENSLIFDIEVLVQESDAPIIAVAMSDRAWYLWVSPRLFENLSSNRKTICLEDLIPLYQENSDTSTPKCIIGHFVSYDRARIAEEYCLKPTGIRFLDTMSLHICVSGLTSTQRNLKLASDKHLYSNKLWKDFVADHTIKHSPENREPNYDALDWIKETSLNNLLDVYRLYCKKEPPQNKSKRKVFETGNRQDVVDNFQELASYCACDVQMTFDIWKYIWPLFRKRFPSPVTLGGLLEMGSMYLPINKSWLDFQERSNMVFNELQTKQRNMLQHLAEEALKRHNDGSKSYEKDPWLWDLDWSKPKRMTYKSDDAQQVSELPKWYRELIPKPVKEHYKHGPSLITAQMKISPKLLRLCWKGLPLHFDQTLKWGTLIPGRIPKPVGDPRYFKQPPEPATPGCNSVNRVIDYASSSNPRIRSSFTVVKMAASGSQELQYPYQEYLKYWEVEIERRLLGLTSPSSATWLQDRDSSAASAYQNRVAPDPRDGLLLDELRRSVATMPLDADIVYRLISALRNLEAVGASSVTDLAANQVSSKPVYEHLGELQAAGALFWQIRDRYDAPQPNRWTSNTRRKQLRRSVCETVNPEIPTCWFCPLPHEGGVGLPVGSPLSRPFQVHIAAGRLHSAPLPGAASSDSEHFADNLLQDRIKISFWQSYSKRVMTQMYVFLPKDVLPACIQSTIGHSENAGMQHFGAILPQVIAAGTISRRAVEPLWLTASNAEVGRLGSEIKAMVQSPPGYSIVGADVDSQEMWIASLIGDAVEGFQGSTPYGWMTLEGSKANGTDLHTKTAHLIGIERNEAKVLNYARLYGSGLEFTKQLLSKFQSNLRPEEASMKAEKLMRATKGQKTLVEVGRHKLKKTSFSCASTQLKSIWEGGSESTVFNALEAIARSPEPRTPVLGAQITRALTPKAVKDDFLPSRINWVVQSSAVDYLHCLLVSMAWLIHRYRLPARLCLSIHDEVRYLCDDRANNQVVLALQISNLLTRSFFAYQLGMRDLPESVAYFSSVDVDRCLRKNPLNDCQTPSNPEGLEATYGIPKGESLTIAEIIKRTDGIMRIFSENAD